MRGDEPAFPCSGKEKYITEPDGTLVSLGLCAESGLTKREWMATMILAGMWGSSDVVVAAKKATEAEGRPEQEAEWLAATAAQQADALLAELTKAPSPKD